MVINILLFQSKLAAAPANPESHTLKKSKRKNKKHRRDKKSKSGSKAATPSAAAPDDDADNGYIIFMNQPKPQGASPSEKVSKVGNGYERISRDSE